MTGSFAFSGMDEKWQKVREIFDSALRREPEERSQFVNKACGADKSLLIEVESLLSSLDSADSFLETPVASKVADIINPEIRTLERGQTLGHYEIIEQIGAGGMGEVFLARDTRLNRKVALKLLASHITDDQNRVSRFRQEAFATSALNHPNIVTIYEIGEWQGRDFIATEFIDGVTLRTLLRKKKLGIGEGLDIILQIASALAAAHGAGVVHRDIKPENIMIRPDGLVKVLDFGIAKYRPSEGGQKALIETGIGEIIGTAAYMSPEQARGQEIDQRTDIWSLGVILYEMIARKLPFAGETKSDRIAAILEREPVPLTKLNQKVSPQLQQILNRALAKDKERRYANITDMSEDLYLLRETTGDKHSAPFIFPARKPFAWQRNYLFALSALVVFLAGAIALGFYFSLSRKTAPSDKKSIAVLPLKPINTASRDEIYEIGIADSLIQRLSSIKGFVVRPLSAIRKYADIEQDPLAAGREQQVDYVLASNYQIAGGKVRVTSQLLNVESGEIEETYKSEKDSSDVFAMQDMIASELGKLLQTHFAFTSGTPAATRGTNNEEAYRLYLQAMYIVDIHTLSTAQKAVELLERAVELDPDYAQAWAGKAYAHRGVANFIGRSGSTYEDTQKSMEAIKRALSLDENLADAYSTLCENKMYYEYDFVEAESACKRGIELNPNSPLAHQVYSRYLLSRRRFDEAITEIKTTIDLEPASLFYNSLYGMNLYYARRYPEAIAQFKRVIAMDENFSHPYYWLCVALAAQGNESEAFGVFMKVYKPDEATAQAFQTAYQSSGWRGVMQELAKRFEQNEERYFFGAFYNAQAGNKDKAFEYLEKSYQRREMWMAYLQVDPRLDPLRGDPRFEALVRRVESK
jgi:eukaryotic-like serine/threonine-protein kinase